MSRDLLIKITCGAEAAERANQALTVAALATASGAEVTVWLTGEATWFAVRGKQPELNLPYATPAVDLMEAIRVGGSIQVCSQCAARRELTEDQLLDGVGIAGAATFVESALADDVQVLIY